MLSSPANFEVELNGVKISVQELDLPDLVAFHVTFSSKRAPIVIARADDFIGNKFWTSIPEGRQKEAEGVGKLIEEYFSSQNK